MRLFIYGDGNGDSNNISRVPLSKFFPFVVTHVVVVVPSISLCITLLLLLLLLFALVHVMHYK